jgi:hypothetical protein
LPRKCGLLEIIEAHGFVGKIRIFRTDEEQGRYHSIIDSRG